MSRRSPWELDIRDALRGENWSLMGPNRIVKVLPLVQPQSLGGYFTVARFIRRTTPQTIQAALGLEESFLDSGSMICNFTRLPMSHEYEYELTADYPDGLTFTFLSNPRYLPGSSKIPQWRLKSEISIPVGEVIRLQPGQLFQR
jgi:hypothetical protein